jgi:hypothetical protein
MNEACPRQPEGGKLTATHVGDIARNFKEIFTTEFWVITDIFEFLAFLAHFGPGFKAVIENLDAGRGAGCFEDIKMRLGPGCWRLWSNTFFVPAKILKTKKPKTHS